MRLVVQRVRRARVTVDGNEVAAVSRGAVVLLGVARDDTDEDAAYLARKVSGLRIFDDEDGKLNNDIRYTGGSFLVVSQFTLYGDCRKGNRPSYIEAAAPGPGREKYDAFVRHLREQGHTVQTGRFQETMVVELDNDGPVTLVIESRGRTRAA